MLWSVNEDFQIDLRCVEAAHFIPDPEQPRVRVLMACGEWLTFYGENGQRVLAELQALNERTAERQAAWEKANEEPVSWWRRLLGGCNG